MQRAEGTEAEPGSWRDAPGSGSVAARAFGEGCGHGKAGRGVSACGVCVWLCDVTLMVGSDVGDRGHASAARPPTPALPTCRIEAGAHFGELQSLPCRVEAALLCLLAKGVGALARTVDPEQQQTNGAFFSQPYPVILPGICTQGLLRVKPGTSGITG